MDAAAYARLLKGLLPPGRAWNLESDSWLSKALLGCADQLAEIHARALDLMEETDPRTAWDTLDDWERILDLPDSCIETIPATDAGRRVAITQKLVRLGGQSRAYYEQLALAAGYTVAIDDNYRNTIFRTGRGRTGERLYSPEWAHVWRLDVSPPTGTALSHDELECVITRVAPAHTVVFFEYLP